MPLIILKTFPPKILLLLPRVCRFEECTNLVATSENKWNASQSLVQNRKEKKRKKTRVPVMPDSGKKKKKRKRVAFVTANEALEWMERRPGICRSEPSLRQCTFVFEIRDDRTLLPFYNHAFSHFARIFFFFHLASRNDIDSILNSIRRFTKYSVLKFLRVTREHAIFDFTLVGEWISCSSVGNFPSFSSRVP